VISSITKKILFVCPYCHSADVFIRDVLISRNKQNIIINDEIKIKSDDNQEEDVIGFELCCSSPDCPSIKFSFVQNEGLSIDFSGLDNGIIERMRHNYIISEKISGLVEFTDKNNGGKISIKKNATLGTWVLSSDNIEIKPKEVNNSNSNFLNFYHEVAEKGIQITRWLRSNTSRETQIKLYMCRIKDGKEKFFWRYRVKENDKWIKSRDNIPIEESFMEEIHNAWVSGRTESIERIAKNLL